MGHGERVPYILDDIYPWYHTIFIFIRIKEARIPFAPWYHHPFDMRIEFLKHSAHKHIKLMDCFTGKIIFNVLKPWNSSRNNNKFTILIKNEYPTSVTATQWDLLHRASARIKPSWADEISSLEKSGLFNVFTPRLFLRVIVSTYFKYTVCSYYERRALTDG